MASSEYSPEPLFAAISGRDVAFQAAYSLAASTLPHFIALLEQRDGAIFSVKLRFRDPDESERLGEDRFAYIWLTSICYHPDDRVFSGVFFELPAEFQKWHQVGEHLVFEPEDVFDWMVLQGGHLHGGFTLRVSRSKMPESERESFDKQIGVRVYEPYPT
jgi:uncharacterized protein YegJ (DUF2314 family)